jgi:hypothetical protein
LGIGGVNLSRGALKGKPTKVAIPKNKGARAVNQQKAAFGDFLAAVIH